MVDDLRILFFDNAHDIVHEWVFKHECDVGVYSLFDNFSSCNGFGCGLFVCYNQSAGAEFYASEVSDYNDEYVGQFVGVDLSENGLACRA